MILCDIRFWTKEHPNYSHKALRSSCKVGKSQLHEIAVFKLDKRTSSFKINDDNSRQKVISNEIEVCIAIRI